MSKVKSYNRPAWIDRFQQPTLEVLRESLPSRPQVLFDDARRRFQKLDGVTEHLAWYGDSWFWTIEYRLPNTDEPLALIVPNPEDLQIAMPLDREFADQAATKRLKRAIRDGLELVQHPYDTRWSSWSLTGANVVVELFRLIQQKANYLNERNS